MLQNQQDDIYITETFLVNAEICSCVYLCPGEKVTNWVRQIPNSNCIKSKECFTDVPLGYIFVNAVKGDSYAHNCDMK